MAGGDVLNAVDGCIPSDMATGSTAEIEEERRLLYVAMTRAKDHLHLIVVPQRFYVHAAGRRRRPPRVRVADPVHPGGAGGAVRAGELAGGGERGGASHGADARGRSRGTDAWDVDVTAGTYCNNLYPVVWHSPKPH